MKTESIKLHLNITKILRYLVFIMIFIFLNFFIGFTKTMAMNVTFSSNKDTTGNNPFTITVKGGKIKGIHVYANGKELLSVASSKTSRGGCWSSSGQSGRKCSNNRTYSAKAATDTGLSQFGTFTKSSSRTKYPNYTNTYIKEHTIKLYGNGSTTNSTSATNTVFDLKKLSSTFKNEVCSATHTNGKFNITVKVNDDNDNPTYSSEVTISVDDYCGPTISLGSSSKYVSKTSSVSINATISDEGNHLNSNQKLSNSNISLSGSSSGCTTSVSNSTSTGATITISGCSSSGTVYIKVNGNSITDTYSNYNLESNSSAISIDNTAPTITVSLPSDATTAKKQHGISGIKFSDSQSGVNENTKYYCLRSESGKCDGTSTTVVANKWIKFTGTSLNANTLTGEYYVHVKVSDNAGNIGYGTTSSKIKLDNTPPEITYTSKTSGKLQEHSIQGLSITDSGGSELVSKKYCWSQAISKPELNDDCWEDVKNKTTLSRTGTVNTDETWHLYIFAKDGAGNTTTVDETFTFDNKGPTIIFSGVPTSTYPTSATIKITVLDGDGSGVSYFEWDDLWNSYTKVEGTTKTISYATNACAGCKITVRVKAYDEAKNYSYNETSFTLYSTYKPTINDFEYMTGKDYAKSHTVKVSYKDNSGSGISTAKYCWAESNKSCTPNLIVPLNKQISRQGNKDVIESYKLIVTVTDNMGHATTKTSDNLLFDNTKPTITLDGSKDYKQSHDLNVKIEDTGSGVIKYSIKCSIELKECSTDYKEYEYPLVNIYKFSGRDENGVLITKEVTVKVKASDKAGNDGEEKTIVLKFDNTNPEVSVSITNEDIWTLSKQITMTPKDGHSGISKTYYTIYKNGVVESTNDSNNSLIKTTLTLVKNGNSKYVYEIEVYTVDKAGNVSDKVKKLIRVENELPVITIPTIEEATIYKKSRTIENIGFSDNSTNSYLEDKTRSGINENTKYYCLGETNVSSECKNWIKFEGTSIEILESANLNGEYYLHVKVEDNIGNTGYALTNTKLYFDTLIPLIKDIKITNSDSWSKTHTVTLRIEDARSGLNELKYKWCTKLGECKNGDTINLNGENSVVQVIEGKNLDGEYYLDLIITDKTKESNTLTYKTAILKFDNTAPILVDINKDELKNQVNNKLVVKASDAHTSVDSVQISWGTEIKDVKMSKDANGNYVYEFPKEVEGKIKITLTLIDILGNKDIKEYEVEVDTVSIIARDKDDNKLATIPNLSIRKPSKVENKVTYEVEEMVEIEEDKEVVVVSEEVEEIEVNVEKENEEIENKVIELANTEVCLTSIKFSYANEELKKLFVLNKKSNKWVVSKK